MIRKIRIVMEKILISACLIGDNCTYKGGNNLSSKVESLLEKYELIPFCPEVEGGLPTPRKPSEIKGSGVFMNDGKNVTREFEWGAKKALMLCLYLKIKIAVLKERSPSCGTHQIHDGTFSEKLIDGMGVTAKLLKENGIKVYSEDEIDQLIS